MGEMKECFDMMLMKEIVGFIQKKNFAEDLFEAN